MAGGEASQPDIHPHLAKCLGSIPAVAPSTPNFDPLKWHEERKAESLVLCLACVLVLGLALAPARNERTFFTVGHVLDELPAQLSPEMMDCPIIIKRNWHLLLHTVEKTIMTKDSRGKPMEVEVQKQEVNWKPIMELYIKDYGRNPVARSAVAWTRSWMDDSIVCRCAIGPDCMFYLVELLNYDFLVLMYFVA